MASLTSQGYIEAEADHDILYDGATYTSGVAGARCQVWKGDAGANICHGTGYFENDSGLNTVLIFKGEVIKVKRLRRGYINETFTCHDNSCGNNLGPWFSSLNGNRMYKGDSSSPLAEGLVDCTSTEGDALDSGNDVCEWYEGKGDKCGEYDDDDFLAADLCCACGGGNQLGVAFFDEDQKLNSAIAANWCG